MNDLTFNSIKQRAEQESAIERMSKRTVWIFCQDAIIDIIRTYANAGVRQEEKVKSDGKPIMLKEDVARIINVKGEHGYALSGNTQYEMRGDREIVLPKGTWIVEYTSFPSFDKLTYDSPLPLPKHFQDAVHWYVCYKYHGRLEGESDTRTSYYARAYNNACREADHFYAGQQRYRRMPCRRIG